MAAENETDMLDLLAEKPSIESKDEKDKDDPDKGVSPKIKNFKALMWTLGPLAGILTVISSVIFGYIKIAEMRHEFKLSEDRIQAQIEEKKADQLRADKERAAHDAEAATTRLAQTRAENDRLAAEQKFKLADIAQRDRADNLNRLYGAIAKTEGAKTTEDTISSLTTIRAYVASTQPDLRRIALGAMKTRLISATSPTEVELICDSLADAGAEGMEVAVFANRKARRMLEPAIRAKTWQVAQDMLALLTRRQHTRASEELKSYARNLVTEQKPAGIDFPDLAVVTALLKATADAIDRMLPSMPQNSTVDLDDCFLPDFYVSSARPIVATTISFRGAYLVGADLRKLDSSFNNGPVLRLSDSPRGSSYIRLSTDDPAIPPGFKGKQRSAFLWKTTGDVQLTDRQERYLPSSD